MLSSQVIGQLSAYSGPIPPPELLKKFDELDPGRAARLMNLAEDQSRHRMNLEKYVIGSDVRRSWAGLVSALLIAAAVVFVGWDAVRLGHPGSAATIITVGLSSLVGTFIYGTSSVRRERTEKARIMSGRK
jgi:uncharacterized membrane protein